jgi:PTH2 family peptidyl-tRNA hydrolase
MARNIIKPMARYKQYIILRSDLDMSTGKMVTQGAHASYLATRKISSASLQEWISEGGTKIALRVNSEAELFELYGRICQVTNIAIMFQEGESTEVKAGSYTAMAIGPIDMIKDHSSQITKILKDVKLL